MKKTLTLGLIVLALVALSCSQQKDKGEDLGSFIHQGFAAAEQAAAQNGQYMILDFYTDS